MPRTSGMDEVLRRSRDNYGSRSAGRAAVIAVENLRTRIGPLELDYALGGGLRQGYIHSFYGEKSGGKTTTALKAIAAHQQLCRNCKRPAKNVVAVPPPEGSSPDTRWSATGECDCFAKGLYKFDEYPEEVIRDENGKKLPANSKKRKEAEAAYDEKMRANSYEEYICCWVDAELSFDPGYATLNGVDCNRLVLEMPSSAEEAIDFMHAMASTVEVDMLVLDSIAQITPSKEIESSTEDWQQGLQARLTNKMARLLVRDGTNTVVNGRSLTQIWINQTRQKIGVMFGDPTTKPGGKGQEFAVHAEVKFKGSKVETDKVQWGTKDEVDIVPLYEIFRFSVTKNKSRSMKSVEGSYKHRTRKTGSGDACSLVEDDGIYKRTMHYLVTPDPKTKTYKLGKQEFKSQKEISTKISTDPDFRNALKTVLLERMLKDIA